MSAATPEPIPTTQTVALVNELGGELIFKTDYPVPKPGPDEVLVKVLYTGVCQSDLHTKAGTASGPTGAPITAIKLPHIGGHEGVGRIVSLGSNVSELNNPALQLNKLLGIRFLSRICHTCVFCRAGMDQHCPNASNHLHHEDGSFQQYCVLPTDYVTPLPSMEEMKDRGGVEVLGPTLCAGVTAYKAVSNTEARPGDWVVVVGAGGGLGHFAVQYAQAKGMRVVAVDSGDAKRKMLVERYHVPAEYWVDFKHVDVVQKVMDLTEGIGAHGVVVTSGSSVAYAQAADMLRPGGTLACCGIPPPNKKTGEVDAFLRTPIPGIVIKGIRVFGNLVGSSEETMEALELVRCGLVRPMVEVRPFKELGDIYERLENGDVCGRIVVKVAEDE